MGDLYICKLMKGSARDVRIDAFDQIHSENTRKKNGAGYSIDMQTPPSTNLNGSTSQTRSSAISIADVLDIVNDTYPYRKRSMWTGKR